MILLINMFVSICIAMLSFTAQSVCVAVFFASAVNDLPPNRKTGSYISIPDVILAYFAFNVLFFMQV